MKNFMINGVTMKINVDEYILNTLREDITSEDVSTNAVMPGDRQGRADLICKQDGIICGLDIFKRTFELLDSTSRFEANFKDGDRVHKGDLLGVIYGPNVMGYGICFKPAYGFNRNLKEKLAVFNSFRACNRFKLALLLSCTSDWTCK